MTSISFVSTSQTNRTVENIGARRLHTVIERIVEEVSFDAPDKAGQTFVIDEVCPLTCLLPRIAVQVIV